MYERNSQEALKEIIMWEEKHFKTFYLKKKKKCHLFKNP